jgi:hypothetical protein
MLRFYLSLVREIPAVLRSSVEAYLFWALSIVAPLAVLVRPNLQPFLDTPEFSRWLVFVPIVASVSYGMLRANFARFKGLEDDLQRLATDYRSLTTGLPRLMLREPGALHIEPVVFNITVGPPHLRAPLWTADFMKVRFVNDPETTAASSLAVGVTAKISILQDGNLLKRIDGRWSESEQPGERIARSQTITDLLEMNFPIGAERSLDVAFKMRDDRVAYLFNNDNYLAQPDMKHPNHQLSPGVYTAEVRLRAVNVDAVFRWNFRVHDAGGTFELLL